MKFHGKSRNNKEVLSAITDNYKNCHSTVLYCASNDFSCLAANVALTKVKNTLFYK